MVPDLGITERMGMEHHPKIPWVRLKKSCPGATVRLRCRNFVFSNISRVGASVLDENAPGPCQKLDFGTIKHGLLPAAWCVLGPKGGSHPRRVVAENFLRHLLDGSAALGAERVWLQSGAPFLGPQAVGRPFGANLGPSWGLLGASWAPLGELFG